MNPLSTWLQTQTQAQLVELIEAQCEMDGDFRNHLRLHAAAAQPAQNMEEIKRSIHNAFWIEDFVDWRGVGSYTSNIDPVIETLNELLKKGEAECVAELVEEAFECWAEAANNIHDDGEMGMISDELHELHLRACRKAKPDPEVLAEDLFLTAFFSEWSIFSTAYSTYARIWGKPGSQRYRELVEKKWEKLPRLKPGKDDPKRYENKSGWLDSLMIEFAQEEDDFDREVEIRQRDLSNAWNFQQIANRWIEQKNPAEALIWIENGIHEFNDDSGLKRTCAELYWKTKRRNDALLVWWNLFELNRTLETYKILVTHAGKIKKRTEWQSKALDSIRAYIAAAQGKKQSYWNRVDHSLLVEIFLWEGDSKQAWIEANAGGCSADLWIKLCKKREADRPDEVYPVYMKLAEEKVMRKNNDAYHTAVRLIQNARQLAEHCEQSGAFGAMLSKIKMMHKPKRNFMKYLAEAGL